MDYVATLPKARLYRVEWVAEEGRWIGKYLEGSCRGLIAVLFQNLSGGTEGNHENTQDS
jgi:hypothetical protein